MYWQNKKKKRKHQVVRFRLNDGRRVLSSGFHVGTVLHLWQAVQQPSLL